MWAWLRLNYFEWRYGNAAAMAYLRERVGAKETLALVSALQWRLLFRHPLKPLPPVESMQDRLSRKQMAPLLALYQILMQRGYERDDAIDLLAGLSEVVAVKFLEFNVPQIRKDAVLAMSEKEQQHWLQKLTHRFFNAKADLHIEGDEQFEFTVKRCYFADYTRELGMAELGPLFCASDRYYFEQHQPEVAFYREQTLAQDGKPCDFRFRWREPATDASGESQIPLRQVNG